MSKLAILYTIIVRLIKVCIGDIMKVVLYSFSSHYAICKTQDNLLIQIEKYRLPFGAGLGSILILSEKEILIEKINSID